MSLASTMGNNFFYLASNQGTGALSLTPTAPDTIDGSTPSIALNPGESCFVICSGSTWYTVGSGRSNTFAYSILSKNVAGSSNVTLTTAEAANLIHTYFGALTGNINVILPTVIQQYTIYNNTTGAYTLTVKTSAGTGYTITQGYRVIVYCDGTDILSSSTLATGSVSSVGITPPAAGITVSGSPVTSSGNITLALADDLAALEGLTGTGYAYRSGTSTWAVSTSIVATGAHGTNAFGAIAADTLLAFNTNTGSAATSYGLVMAQTAQSGVTTLYEAFRSAPQTAVAAFTLATLRHFSAANTSLGVGSAITTQQGFYSNITAATGAWNFYAASTANNAFNGNTRFGGVTAPTVAVDVTGSLSVSGAIVGRINPRITNVASSATPTPDVSTTDQYNLTALAAAAAFAVPAGTPLDGQKLIIRIKDNGTARALTYNAIYRAVGVTLPTTTVISKTTYLGLIYNVVIPSWDVVAVATEV